MRVELAPDGVSIAMAGERWSVRFPPDDLPKWLGLYRRLRDLRAPRDKKGNTTGQGPRHGVYAPIVQQLESIARDLRAKKGSP